MPKFVFIVGLSGFLLSSCSAFDPYGFHGAIDLLFDHYDEHVPEDGTGQEE